MGNEYWAERQAKAQANLHNKSVKQIEKQLNKYYSSAMEKILGQFELTYNKVFSRIEEGKEPTPADLYKLDSYWKLQGQMRAELEKLGNRQAVLLSKEFERHFIEIYNALAIPSQQAYSTLSTETVQQMINHIWTADGKNWSNRIWGNTEKLMEELNNELIHCVAAGKKTTELKNLLQERFGASYSRADALVRTEIAHIQTQAAKKRYESYGIGEVEIWADEDERRCDVCGKLHQKRYPIGAAVPIPAHPRCRCCIVPVVESNIEVENYSKASYNGYESSFQDNVDFEKNRDVKKALKSERRIFVTPYSGKERSRTEFFHNLMGEFAENIAPLSGYYDIVAHGLPTSVELYKTSINSETLAKIIIARGDYKKGTPIRLLSCFTGENSGGTCLAQELANMLETEVIAPDFELIISEAGKLYKNVGKERVLIDEKDFKRFSPKRR